MTVYALVVAGGNQTRMKGEDKLFSVLGGKPVLLHGLVALQHNKEVDQIVIVSKPEAFDRIELLVKDNNLRKVIKIIEGGKERQNSVFNGLQEIKGEKGDIILVHNACNPFVSQQEMTSCVSKAQETGAAVVGYPLKDTIKKVNEDGQVVSTLPRDQVYQVQTPQCIEYSLFVEGFKQIREKQMEITDDVSVVEALGKPVSVVQCSYKNFKITTKEDLELARSIVEGGLTGLGEDSHQFTNDSSKKLVLGGYVIEGEKGFDANSDGDVILHALYNALSSAMGGRSLSIESDPLCKQGVTNSREYLKPLLQRMKGKKLSIKNMSISIEAKIPKLEPHHDNIKESLRSVFSLQKDQIGLTFTTGEDMTEYGRGKGMYCKCVVSLLNE